MPHTTRFRHPDLARLWLAALLLAVGLRVYRLDAQSLWYDEAVTAQVAGQGLAELTRWTADDIQPPLYYYAVAGWTRLVGRSEWALRFPSVFFGVLTVALLWTLARRLFGKTGVGRGAAGIVALLAALSPLHVYYAQEARMYTLLTFGGVLAGYALLRASGRAEGQRGRRAEERRWWVMFVLASTAMLYTHYFGVFLLVAYALCFLMSVATRWLTAAGGSGALKNLNKANQANLRPLFSRRLIAFAISVLAIILLYLPWLPAMLNRYRVDASYWQGGLKLGEALRHVAISFTMAAPEMMLEGDALRLLPWFGLALVSSALALGVFGKRQKAVNVSRSLACLSTCLLVPVLCVLFLASRTPKFNPRYLMLASPAYLLILAGGIGALWDNVAKGPRSKSPNNAPRNTHYALRSTSAFLLSIFLIAIALIGLRNWFNDPAFTKAQWRSVAAYVRQEKGSDETVLLVSGHAYPAWDYYAPDIAAIRLPAIDILDVEAVLGFEIGPTLTQGLRGKRGAWLVTWQDEVVDPVGFVPYFLDRGGHEQLVKRQFWHLGLRHWQLAPDAVYPAEPRPQHTDGANFDHKLALLGWDDPLAGQITVYWRALNTLPADYQVSLILENAAGREVGRWDGRPAGYGYPTTRWRPGETLFGRYPVPLPASAATSAAADDYTVTLAVYDDADPSGLDLRDVADNSAGKRVRLGPVKIE